MTTCVCACDMNLIGHVGTSCYIGQRDTLDSYRINAHRSSINTYIYIFQHNLCKMQVYKLVLNSSNSSINFNSGSVDLKVFGTSMSRFIDVKFKHNFYNSC